MSSDEKSVSDEVDSADQAKYEPAMGTHAAQRATASRTPSPPSSGPPCGTKNSKVEGDVRLFLGCGRSAPLPRQTLVSGEALPDLERLLTAADEAQLRELIDCILCNEPVRDLVRKHPPAFLLERLYSHSMTVPLLQEDIERVLPQAARAVLVKLYDDARLTMSAGRELLSRLDALGQKPAEAQRDVFELLYDIRQPGPMMQVAYLGLCATVGLLLLDLLASRNQKMAEPQALALVALLDEALHAQLGFIASIPGLMHADLARARGAQPWDWSAIDAEGRRLDEALKLFMAEGARALTEGASFWPPEAARFWTGGNE